MGPCENLMLTLGGGQTGIEGPRIKTYGLGQLLVTTLRQQIHPEPVSGPSSVLDKLRDEGHKVVLDSSAVCPKTPRAVLNQSPRLSPKSSLPCCVTLVKRWSFSELWAASGQWFQSQHSPPLMLMSGAGLTTLLSKPFGMTRAALGSGGGGSN